MARVGVVFLHVGVGVELFPLLKALDVLVEVVGLALGGVPERSAEEDAHVDHGTGPDVEFASVVGACQ